MAGSGLVGLTPGCHRTLCLDPWTVWCLQKRLGEVEKTLFVILTSGLMDEQEIL